MIFMLCFYRKEKEMTQTRPTSKRFEFQLEGPSSFCHASEFHQLQFEKLWPACKRTYKEFLANNPDCSHETFITQWPISNAELAFRILQRGEKL